MRGAQGQEKRLVSRMQSYWERLSGEEEGLPNIHKFNHNTIADLWPSCFTLELEATASKKYYKYEYMGERIVEAYGKNLVGQRVSSNIRNVPGASVLEKIDHVVDTRKPGMEQGQFVNDKDKIVKYRSCILPFGTRDNYVTHVIVGLSWRAF